jgi:hypothetical protein
VALYKALARAGVPPPPPGQGEAAPESRLFRVQSATKALLDFLATTNIGCFLGEAAQEAKRASRYDLRGLELVEEAESQGGR